MLATVVSILAALVINAAGVSGSTLPISGRSVDVNKFRLETSADYIPSLEASHKNGASSTGSDVSDYVKIATSFVQTTVPGNTFRLVGDHYIGVDGIAHVYFKQTAHELDIDNADFNVNVSTRHSNNILFINMQFLFF
jgi:extracellular elastinolytic metalloproteinase